MPECITGGPRQDVEAGQRLVPVEQHQLAGSPLEHLLFLLAASFGEDFLEFWSLSGECQPLDGGDRQHVHGPAGPAKAVRLRTLNRVQPLGVNPRYHNRGRKGDQGVSEPPLPIRSGPPTRPLRRLLGPAPPRRAP